MNNDNVKRITDKLVLRTHLQSIDEILRTITPDFDHGLVRRRTVAAYSAIHRAGKLRYVKWAVLCIVAAIGLGALSVWVPALAAVLGVLGLIAVGIGMIMAILVDPNAIIACLDSYFHSSEATIKEWTNTVQEKADVFCGQATANIGAFTSEHLAGGTSVVTIKTAINLVQLQVEELARQARSRLSSPETAGKHAGGRASAFDQIYPLGQSWLTRLLPAKLRRNALTAITENDKIVTHKREQIIVNTLVERALDPLATFIKSYGGQFDVTIITPLTLLGESASNSLKEMAGQGGRDFFGKFLPSEHTLEEEASKTVGLLKSSLYSLAAQNLSSSRLVPELTSFLDGKIRDALPKSIGQCIAGMNGTWENAMTSLDAEATEQVIARKTPGREQARYRTIMIHGSAGSSIFSEIEAHSSGCQCRRLEYGHDDEILVVTEERYLPGAEMPELVESSEILKKMPDSKRLGMVVAVEDDDFIFEQCNPDQRSDTKLGLRLLVLARVLGGITRKKGENYSLSDLILQRHPDLVPYARLGQGFDVAAEALQTDPRIGPVVDSWVKAEISNSGTEQVKALLKSAIAKTDFVPAVHASKCRQILSEQANRLNR